MLRPDGLVARRALVALLHARELPHNPVCRLDQPVCSGIDRWCLVQDLPRLGKEPFRTDLATVAVQEGVSQLAGDLIQLVGFRLRGVVLPQFDPGVRFVPPFRQKTERRAVRQRWEHGTSCEVNADANYVIRLHAAFGQYRRNRRLEHFQIIIGVLQRPIRLQGNRGAGQGLVDDAIRVQMHAAGQLTSCGDIHQHRAT